MNDLQVEQIIALLTEIRDGQREFIQALLAPVEETPRPCTHPPETRTDRNPSARFWKCNAIVPSTGLACGFIYDSEKGDS